LARFCHSEAWDGPEATAAGAAIRASKLSTASDAKRDVLTISS
jgi:hypothetical protein